MNGKSTKVLGSMLVSLVLFISLLIGLAIPAQTARAATLTVCASGCAYTTIQAAIDAASAGDTITVGAGMYAGQLNVNKSLTILGDPGDASAGPGANAPVIDGGGAIGSAFFIANGVSNVTIKGFEMRNYINGAGFGQGNGVSAWVASTSNITIQDNYFHDLGYNGVLVGNDHALGDHTNWTIKANILETFKFYGFELTNTSNSSIEDNIIHSDAVSDPKTCIMVDARRNESGLTIKNNQIDGALPGGIAAVFIFANSFEVANANLDNVLVEHNLISTTGPKPHVEVRNYPGTGTVTGVKAHLNNFLLLKTNTPAQVDATLNWWGDLDPSNNVIGNVSYYPWCTNPECTSFANLEKDTAGVFRPGNGDFYLKNANSSGFADVAISFGQPGDQPITGDWDGNGTDTIGVFRNGSFLLRNANTPGAADIIFAFGLPGDQPVVGDWNGDGIDTVGVYRNGRFYLRNSNSAGTADVTFLLGNPGDLAIAGDWNGDGLDSAGVFRPGNGMIFLKNALASGIADISFNYGRSGDQPVVGDWNNDGTDTIGIYRNGSFYLRNANTPGFADLVFTYGLPGDIPIAGNWDGFPSVTVK